MQDKLIQITNVDINVTGIIANGIDPFNGLFENITIDAYGLQRGMEFYTSCNYPEASLQNAVEFNNIKAIMSSDRTILSSPSIIEYQGPGNMTVKNSDFSEFYNNIVELRKTLGYFMQEVCAPNDGLVQLFTFDNITTSALDNEVDTTKFNNFVLTFDTTLYRNIKTYIENSQFVNHEHLNFGLFYIGAQQNVEAYITD